MLGNAAVADSAVHEGAFGYIDFGDSASKAAFYFPLECFAADGLSLNNFSLREDAIV